MKSIARNLFAAVTVLVLLVPGPGHAGPGRPVIELFTSQGCSSCPPADAFLGELASRSDVITLSYHVDYWNYIGWRDPFSAPESTRRQRAYRRTLKLSYVYTPQIVVDGDRQAVGSDRRAVRRLIGKVRARRRLAVRLQHGRDGTTRVVIPAAAHRGPAAEIWAAFYDRSHTTRIGAGENTGRTVTNSNVVRKIQRLGSWRGRKVEIILDPAKLGGAGRDGCAILIQEAGPGRIIGAATISLTRR